MPDDPKNPNPRDPDEFDLDKPSGDFSAESGPPKQARPGGAVPVPPTADTFGSTGKSATWKGFEDVEAAEPEFDLLDDEEMDNEIDMTPMVDVTFLLLIFFMVTASFITQRAAQQPDTQEDVPSTVVVDFEDQEDYVEVIIDQNNMYRIGGKNYEEVEAPSDTEMKSILADAKQSLDARRLIVTAHEEAAHQRVVTVWDYGKTLKFDEIQIQTTDKEY